MTALKQGRDLLAKAPFLDAWFRRLVWSRIHHPEDELRFLSQLGPGSVDVAIDVGGALGSYAWPLNRKARRVIVFEPGEVHAAFIAHAQPFSRIELHRAAVGSTDGEVDLITPGDDVDARHRATVSRENPTVDPAVARHTRVRLVTLDAFAEANITDKEHVDILKVDVEGFELAVFEGAQCLLAKHHPLIFCEIEERHNPQYRDVFELLCGLGYEAFYTHHGHLHRLDSFDISALQSDEALAYRIGNDYRPGRGEYVNNFLFEHPSSRVTVSKGRKK